MKRISIYSLARIAISGLLLGAFSPSNTQAANLKDKALDLAKCGVSCNRVSCKNVKKLNECASNCEHSRIMKCLLANCQGLTPENKTKFEGFLKSENTKAENSLKEKEKKMANIQEAINHVKGTIEELKQKIKDTDAQLKSAKSSQKSALKSESSKLKSTLKENEASVKKSLKEIEKLQKETREISKDLKSLAKKINQCQMSEKPQAHPQGAPGTQRDTETPTEIQEDSDIENLENIINEPVKEEGHTNTPPSTPTGTGSESDSLLTPPPPPPPLESGKHSIPTPPPPPPPPPFVHEGHKAENKVQNPTHEEKKATTSPSQHQDLLTSIQKGKQLKKVETNTPKDVSQGTDGLAGSLQHSSALAKGLQNKRGYHLSDEDKAKVDEFIKEGKTPAHIEDMMTEEFDLFENNDAVEDYLKQLKSK